MCKVLGSVTNVKNSNIIIAQLLFICIAIYHLRENRRYNETHYKSFY